MSVEQGIYVDPTFEEVSQVGMIHLQLCFNTTYLPHLEDEEECTLHELSTEDVEDTMFQVARSLAFMGLLLGGFLSVSYTHLTLPTKA